MKQGGKGSKVLSMDQKNKVSQFVNFTGSSDKVAADCLKSNSWNVEAAVDQFYASGLSATVTGVDTRQVDAMFAKYKDSDSDVVAAEGIMQFCQDMGVEPADVVMLVISFYMEAATMGEFTKQEFHNGMLKLNCDTIDKIKKKLPDLRRELDNDDKFRDIYNYAYGFSCEKGQKCVQFDTACAMWQLLLGQCKPWPQLDNWTAFLTKHHNRAISKDTWSQLFEFIKVIKPDFSNFDENSAWPYLLDEFVDFCKEQK